MCFFGFWHILGSERWHRELRPHSGYFWTKNIFCPNPSVFAKFEHRSIPNEFCFWGIAAFGCDCQHSRRHPSEAGCGAKNTENPVFSGGEGTPRRGAACTSGVCGSDGACARSRKNGAPNRPTWLQLLLLRAYGTIRPTILARFVAAAAAFASPPPKIPPRRFRGGGAK